MLRLYDFPAVTKVGAGARHADGLGRALQFASLHMAGKFNRVGACAFEVHVEYEAALFIRSRNFRQTTRVFPVSGYLTGFSLKVKVAIFGA